MKYLLSLTLLLTPLVIHAEIYRGVDEAGNVFYSDKEQANTELIPTPTPNAISIPKLEPKKPVAKVEQTNSYKSFHIISPENNATIRDNSGTISINLSIQPSLDIKNGHQISIYLDGQRVITNATELTIQLPNISRGKHTLSAKIIDSKGKQIISSNSVTIHMKRTSSQHGKSSNEQSGPKPGPQGIIFEPDPQKTIIEPGPQGVIFKPGPIKPSDIS